MFNLEMAIGPLLKRGHSFFAKKFGLENKVTPLEENSINSSSLNKAPSSLTRLPVASAVKNNDTISSGLDGWSVDVEGWMDADTTAEEQVWKSIWKVSIVIDRRQLEMYLKSK